MPKLIEYLKRQLAAYRQVHALSELQTGDARGLSDSPALLAITKERESVILEISRIDNLLEDANIHDAKSDAKVIEVQDKIREIIEKIIANDNKTNELIKKRKEALALELKGLNRGKSLSKKYGNCGHAPKLLSIRR